MINCRQIYLRGQVGEQKIVRFSSKAEVTDDIGKIVLVEWWGERLTGVRIRENGRGI